ncbi:MAG: carboxypeptidase-like regulatory domain-containing protein, partial [Gammaproteobacteria bacterium]
MNVVSEKYGLSLGMAALLAMSASSLAVAQSVNLDADDIGGVVTSENGAEAGVWVVAETDDLDTFFAKIVVTDDNGRYVVPDLPDANYEVWVRGYGLADSDRVDASPGDSVDLTAIVAPSAAVAAEAYPAIAWYSMMHLPSEDELENIEGGLDYYRNLMTNNGCVGCHQMGQKAIRTIPESLGDFSTHQEAWIRRVQSGQAGGNMITPLTTDLGGLPFKYFGDWTQRVEDGELPSFAPERPQGLERNIVATVRDWADPKSYLHDLISTDRRNPTVNGYGHLYGSPELSTDNFPILDPIANTDWTYAAPVMDSDTPTTNEAPVVQPSPYWGDERIWDSKANSHNPMLDQDGLVWYTARVRGPETMDFCREGSDHPSAQAFATQRANRHLSVMDPETGDYQFIPTCYSTHHLQFAYDDNDTLWTSGGGEVVGWVDRTKFLETGDYEASQGWT